MSSRLDFLRKLGGIAVATSIPTSILNAQPSEDKVIKDFVGYNFVHDSTKPIMRCNFGNRALASALDKIFNTQTDRQIKASKLEKEGKIEEAIKLYEKNVSEECWNSYSYERLRIIYRNQGKYEDVFRIILMYLMVNNELKQSGIFETSNANKYIEWVPKNEIKENDIELPYEKQNEFFGFNTLFSIHLERNNLYDYFVHWHYKTKDFLIKNKKKIFPDMNKERYSLYEGTKEEQSYAWMLMHIRDIEHLIKNGTISPIIDKKENKRNPTNVINGIEGTYILKEHKY